MKDVQIMRLEAAINQARRFIDGICDRCECGAHAAIDQRRQSWRVECEDRCGEGTAFYSTREEAATAWNQMMRVAFVERRNGCAKRKKGCGTKEKR